MAESWRKLLNEYVSLCNRMEVERCCEPLRAIVADEAHIRKRTGLFDRLSDAAPGAYPPPVHCETRARPLITSRQEQLVTVRLELLRKLTHADGRTQERVDRERLTLARRQGAWRVSKVDTDIPERHPLVPTGHPAGESLPYINRRVLDKREYGARPIRYDREAARAYADKWWDSANPSYHHFEVDCTNFVSQCLFAGGIPMNYTGRRDSGWWYEGYIGTSERWSYSWAVAHSLQTYLLSERGGAVGRQAADPRELALGDIISYDWEGDARYTHTTIVTAFDSSGYPLVNAHTNDSRHRYWDYRDSYAWTAKTRYTFIHIHDTV